jgi:hypothetical protein
MRIKFNQEKYDYVFDEESKETLKKTEEEPSLLKTIEAWLERTPGLATYDYTETGNKIEDNFLLKEYEKSVNRYLKDTYVLPAEVKTHFLFTFLFKFLAFFLIIRRKRMNQTEKLFWTNTKRRWILLQQYSTRKNTISSSKEANESFRTKLYGVL